MKRADARLGFARAVAVLVTALTFLTPSGLRAQGEDKPEKPPKRLDVSCLTVPPPKIDGLIDDACWQAVQPVGGFYQYDPVNGARASEETFVWAAYDPDHLYFAFLMKDSQPEKIWAELTPRNEWENNDAIELILDAYNDKRTSLTFAVNPRGVQKNSVETIWRSEAALRPDGWSAEMAIPFKSLRFSSDQLAVWGVNFERHIHRLNETDTWTDVSRDLPRLQQTGELCGLTGLRPGHNLEFFPYAGVRSSRWEGAKDNKGAAGLDFKWGIRPNVYLDLTASPDFSEVESDPFIYQLSPYENYLQENRPFFSEGRQYFEQEAEDISLFYSRRIHDPRFAAKFSGKTGGWGFGLLGAVNKEDGADSDFGVFRLQKDIFKNSQLGIYYAGVEQGAERNRNIALDYNFNFGEFYYVQGMSAVAKNRGAPDARNGLHQLWFSREPDAGLQVMAGFQRIEDGVDIKTGYVDRIDVQSFDLGSGYAWRFNRGPLRRLSFDLGGTVRQDSHGEAVGENLEAFLWSEFANRIEVHGGLELGRSRYQVRGGTGKLFWAPDYIGTGRGHLDFSWERGGFLKEVGLEGSFEKRGVYNEDFSLAVPGGHTSVEGRLVLAPWSNLQWSVEGDWIRQTADGTGAEVFNGLAYETALHYQATRSLFLNTRFFGETRDEQYSLDFLVGYYFGAGNIVQLSLKKSERSDLLFGRQSGYSVVLKVSYLLRL